MRKSWGKVVDYKGECCGQCKIFYTHVICCSFMACINRVVFAKLLPTFLPALYTAFFDKFNLFWGGFYTKFLITNNNNYLNKYIY